MDEEVTREAGKDVELHATPAKERGKIGRGRRGELGASERESTSAKCHWAPDSHTHVHKHIHACTHAESKPKALCSQPKCPLPKPLCSTVSRGSGAQRARPEVGLHSWRLSTGTVGTSPALATRVWCHEADNHKSWRLLSAEAIPPHREGQSSERRS